MSLKEDIERELKLAVQVRAGAPGSFRVLVDGEPIFAARHAEHAPESAGIIELIRSKASQSLS